MERLLGHAEGIPEALREPLQRDTGGNPFYIEEYLRLLGNLGAFERKGSTWTLKTDVAIAIPGSLEAAARRRLENVSERRRAILEVSAVLSRPFSSEELRGLLTLIDEEDPSPQGRAARRPRWRCP